MAKVIYTGPLNPVIFARAKKEAEKAERIKGYTPRVIKTPAHTVVYSKTGKEVKAVVMDMLAPITFSIPGSAIPVAPNFLHLHPDLPEKVYGRENYAKATGVTQNWGFNEEGVIDNTVLQLFSNLPIGFNFYYSAIKNPRPGYGWIYKPHDYSFFETGIQRDIGSTFMFDAAERYDESGDLSLGLVENRRGFNPSNPFSTVEPFDIGGEGGFVFSLKKDGGIINAAMNGAYSNKHTRTPTQYETIYEVGQTYTIGITYKSTISVDVISGDVRNIKRNFNDAIQFKAFNGVSNTTTYSLNHYSNVGVRSTQSVKSRVVSGDILSDNYAIGFSGEKIYSFININTKSNSIYDDYFNYGQMRTSFIDSIDVSCSIGIIKNLDLKYYNIQTIDRSQEFEYYTYIGAEQFMLNDVRVFMYMPASVNGFDGVLISAVAFDEWTGSEVNYREITKSKKNTYGPDSVFSQSHLRYYFDFDSNGEYMLDDNVHTKPPRLTTDGICLPHAWFFCRGNETRQTDFYPNNHNRLSIVIYPQGRHEFSVDEAEIVSVELNHTPRFVARPGGGIAFVMQSLFGGNKLVPYVVNGLVEERDEYGEPTGFYLAQDGAISGEFKAPTNGGDPVVSFKLSPRQVFDGYRIVTVETTTEREYGVQTTFEVQGSGGVRVQQPPSITLERINESVLAGQSTVFYVTATQIAVGSNLRYEVKRAGVVVSDGYIRLENCAGWVEFTAPFQSAAVPGDPVRYVLADKSAPSTTPSTVEFEFSLVHEQAPQPVTFSVKFAHELYASSTDRPDALPMPPLFFLQPLVSENGEENFLAVNYQTTLINRIYYSLQSKRVYVLFWDGQSCEVSSLLRKNETTGFYEPNPGWRESPFDYPPAANPYEIKGTLEPYVYKYLEYEASLNQ